MSVSTISTFLAVGALILLACVIAVWTVRLLAIVSPRARRVYDSIRLSIEGRGMLLAWLMALIAMVGSLYYSQVAGFLPCEYCWYQRIAMYPIVLLLGIALLKKDRGIRPYVYGLAIPGGLISTYHYLVERFPDLQVGECNLCIPCSVAWFMKFDLVSIAFMAFVCFAVIVTVLALDGRPLSAPQPPAPEPAESKEPTA